MLPRAARIIGLDEIAVRRGHIHAARVNRALIVHVAIRTRDRDRAARIVDVAFEIDIRCRVVGRLIVIHIRLRAEIVLEGDRGAACLVARLGNKGNEFRLVFVLLLNRRLDRLLAVPLDLGAVEINRTALAGACRALAADDVDISRHQIVRRLICDLHFRIAARLERARAGDIVPFEDDVPELRGDVTHEEIMRHLRVSLAVEQVVFLAVLYDLAFGDFIAIGIVEFSALLGSLLVIEEILRQLDLGVELMVVVDTDIFRCLLLLFLLRQGVLLRDHLVILRRVGGNRIAVARVVASDRAGICRFRAGLRGIGSGLIQNSHLRRSLCILICRLRFRICRNFCLCRIRRHVLVQRLSGRCRQCIHRLLAIVQCRLRLAFCGFSRGERLLRINHVRSRTVIRGLAVRDLRQPIDLILRLCDFFHIGFLDLW